jgi:enoyl-CoA hydratase
MPVDLQRHGEHVAIVTINRPEALNAFNTDLLRELLGVFDRVAADASIRAVVLTGAGERSFVAGADIKEMALLSEAEGREFGQLGHATPNRIGSMPQPVIAAVNGFAFGGGCELAIACDFRIASENAQFAQPEVSLGIPPGWGASQRLPRLIGPGLAADLILTGRRIKAEEALRIGLVNQVVPLSDLIPTAIALAEQIAGNSPRAVTSAKQLMRRAFDGPLDEGLAAEIDAFAGAFGTPDQREGMAAFVEKRAPIYE